MQRAKNAHEMSAALGVAALAIVISLPSLSVAQPPNLGDLKNQILEYQQYGEYDRDLAAVTAQATAYIDAHAADAPKPALVLDIDETSLSNWTEIKADDFGYFAKGECGVLPEGPCGNLAWDARAEAAPIAPTLALFNDAKAHGLAVFFVTGRHEAERVVTERNLKRAGYSGWAALLMEPDDLHVASAADFKGPQRAKIEMQGYHVIANVGDQPSDLAGGHADSAFLLPDPFYRIP
jgi:predicted secreted acid phosphatase